MHRDITSYNLLLTEQWECKVADFNLSRAIKENQIPHSGGFNSIEWQAPERLSGKVCPQVHLLCLGQLFLCCAAVQLCCASISCSLPVSG